MPPKAGSYLRRFQKGIINIDFGFCSLCGSWLAPNEGRVLFIGENKIEIVCSGCEKIGQVKEAVLVGTDNQKSPITKNGLL
jgi:hypothetical protein